MRVLGIGCGGVGSGRWVVLSWSRRGILGCRWQGGWVIVVVVFGVWGGGEDVGELFGFDCVGLVWVIIIFKSYTTPIK